VGAALSAVRDPALALIGADRRIVRSTEAFRRRYENAEEVCERSPELELVLTGQADAATLSAGEVDVAIEAVTDTNGTRHVMLSLPVDEQPPQPGAPIAALREPLDESRAIVWVKDLDGRYMYVNRRYTSDLGTSEERVRGHTDAELPTREAVDGPRVRHSADGLQEPVELEYVVPAFEGRPALLVVRFVMHDPGGQPFGVCGVAAPLDEAQLAREEAARLMRIERQTRLDPAAVRAELLEEWGVARGDGGAALEWPTPVTSESERSQQEHEPPRASADSERRRELEQVRAELELARTEREHAREEREQAWAEREQARVEREQARSEAVTQRERADGLASALVALRTQLAELARGDHQ
jgi:PAS domain-containing protein